MLQHGVSSSLQALRPVPVGADDATKAISPNIDNKSACCVPQANRVIKTCASSPRNDTYALCLLGLCEYVDDFPVSFTWLLRDRSHYFSFFKSNFLLGAA